jgi:Papain family cysteine protease
MEPVPYGTFCSGVVLVSIGDQLVTSNSGFEFSLILKKRAIKLLFIKFIFYLKGGEDELKHAVGLVRPVSVAFEVINGFRLYKSGVFTSDHCGTTPMVSTVLHKILTSPILRKILIENNLLFSHNLH